MQLAELWEAKDRVDEFGSLFKKKEPPPKPPLPYRVVRSVAGRTNVNVDGVGYVIISVADAKTRDSDTFIDAFKVANMQGESLGDFPSFERCVSFLRNPDRAR